MSDLQLRKAWTSDVLSLHQILMKLAGDGLLLPRPLVDLYRHVREFYVLHDKAGEIHGCCALAVVWEDIAEIRSLAVRQELRRQGHGKLLAEACMEEAVNMRIPRVFTLTYQTEFFGKLGFRVVEKDVLPNKVWADCIHCAKFPDCDETAMLVDL